MKKRKRGIIVKRLVIFIILLLIFLASVGIGYFYLNTRDDQKNDNSTDENVIDNNVVENEYISTEVQEEKVSPNAEITKIMLYKECGHEMVETEKADEEIINMTEEELKEKYKDYEIESFSNLNIVLYKEIDGICHEHYVLGEADGIVNIYKRNQNGETELYEVTNIFLDYLPEEMQQQLKEQFEVIGKEELNAVLENFES